MADGSFVGELYMDIEKNIYKILLIIYNIYIIYNK